MTKKTLTIGILGGMGPAATADLFQKIISKTPAERDQEHIRIFIDNNPHIPDRTAALRGKGNDPIPAMLESARGLEKAGADFIIVPCNTAHYFVKQIEKKLDIPVLSMIEATVNYVRTQYPEVKTVGLLASTGTVLSGVYKNEFDACGITMLAPDADEQENLVMESIYGKQGIKAGFTDGLPHESLKKAGEILHKRGAEILLMACTEIPLALRNGDAEIPLLDPTSILAEAAVNKALNGN
jgi:aspartate racemase